MLLLRYIKPQLLFKADNNRKIILFFTDIIRSQFTIPIYKFFKRISQYSTGIYVVSYTYGRGGPNMAPEWCLSRAHTFTTRESWGVEVCQRIRYMYNGYPYQQLRFILSALMYVNIFFCLRSCFRFILFKIIPFVSQVFDTKI